jgi:amino acid transporter
MVMTFVELSGLIIVIIIAVYYIAQGKADFGTLTDISVAGNPALAVLAGVALSFFAMTGFENTANVAEETIDPYKAFPRSLVGGMIVAGLVYVLVSMAAALTVPIDQLAGSDVALLEVVKQGILPFSTDVIEAGGDLDLVNRLALVTVVFLLAIYALVIVTCFKLRGRDEDDRAFRANTPLLVVGLVGNLAILYYVIYDDPKSLLWCAALLAVGGVLYIAEKAFGGKSGSPGASGSATTSNRSGDH